jgi:hypothetical protein
MGFLFLQRRELTTILAAIAATGAVWADVPVVVETPYTVTETQPSTVQAPAGAAAEASGVEAAPHDDFGPQTPPEDGIVATKPSHDDSSAAESELAGPTEIGPEALAEEEKRNSPCREPVEQAAATWLDKSNIVVYQAVCSSVAWFDGFFGSREYDQASAKTFGRVGLSGFWDQRDGFNQHLRFRARYALPHLKKRTSLLIGRGTLRETTKEADAAGPVDSIPSSFNKVEDDSLLIGLGYSRGNGIERGFDFSVGAKLRAPPEPYVKTSYRRSWDVSRRTLISAKPVAYWRYEEGLGAALSVSVDQLVTRRMMLRWSNSGNVSQDREVEGVEWVSRLSLFQQLTNRRALTYGILVHGETQADVALRNYGFEFRYRQRVLRKWLFLELLSSVTWPKDFLWEQRDPNFGAGVGLEMYFGPTPDAQLR